MGMCRHDRGKKRARGNGGGSAQRRAPPALKVASTRKVRSLAPGRTCASDARPTWHHKACVHRFFARRHAEAFAFEWSPGICLGAILASPAFRLKRQFCWEIIFRPTGLYVPPMSRRPE